MTKKPSEKNETSKTVIEKKSPVMKEKPKVKELSTEELEELFEEELDVALLIMLEVFDKYKNILNAYTDYSGDYDNGPSFHVTVNANSKGKLESADINLGFKNLEKFMKSMKS